MWIGWRSKLWTDCWPRCRWGMPLVSLRTQTYFWLLLVSTENNVCGPAPGNNFCDVGILRQSQFSSSSPGTTAWGFHSEEHSSFILSWNLIGQRETKVITSQKSFPGLGSQTLFSAETSNSRKYICVRRLAFSMHDSFLPFLTPLWEGEIKS